MNRKPHIIRLSDGWWCAGFDGLTPFEAYAHWFVVTGIIDLSHIWSQPNSPLRQGLTA